MMFNQHLTTNMRKRISILVLFTIISTLLMAQSNTSPIPDGNTKIGGHLWAGASNEIWTEANSLYFNYRGTATSTYFWNLGGSTGKSIFTILSNGYIGVGTVSPKTFFDVADLSSNSLKSVLARLPEGNSTDDGTYLGVQSYDTQLAEGETWSGGIKSFSLEHKFYGKTNSSINFYRGDDVLGGFISFSTTNNIERMRINTFGNILIGKTNQANTSYKLDVAGKVRADEIIVNSNGADFVFEQDYKLRSLYEVESFINKNKHLPDIENATKMQENGISIGDLQTKLLQKIEELTLYIIEQKKEIDQLKDKLNNR